MNLKQEPVLIRGVYVEGFEKKVQLNGIKRNLKVKDNINE